MNLLLRTTFLALLLISIPGLATWKGVSDHSGIDGSLSILPQESTPEPNNSSGEFAKLQKEMEDMEKFSEDLSDDPSNLKKYKKLLAQMLETYKKIQGDLTETDKAATEKDLAQLQKEELEKEIDEILTYFKKENHLPHTQELEDMRKEFDTFKDKLPKREREKLEGVLKELEDTKQSNRGYAEYLSHHGEKLGKSTGIWGAQTLGSYVGGGIGHAIDYFSGTSRVPISAPIETSPPRSPMASSQNQNSTPAHQSQATPYQPPSSSSATHEEHIDSPTGYSQNTPSEIAEDSCPNCKQPNQQQPPPASKPPPSSQKPIGGISGNGSGSGSTPTSSGASGSRGTLGSNVETGGRDHEGRIFNNPNGKDGVYSQRREGTSIRELASQLASDPEALAAFREALSVNTPAMNKGLSGKETGSEQLSDRRKPSVESYGDSYSYPKNALESGAGTQTSSNTFSGNQSENRSSAVIRSSGVTSLRRGDSFSGSGPSGDFSSSSPQTSGNSNGLTGSSNSFSTGSGSSTNSYSNASAETSARRKTGEQSYNPATYWTLPAGSGNLSDIAEVAAEASTESTGTPTKSNSEKAVASNSISLTPEELGKVKDILAPVPTKATELPAILKAQPGSGDLTDFVDSMGEPSTASRGLASRSPVPKAASKKPSSEKDFWGKVRAFFKF